MLYVCVRGVMDVVFRFQLNCVIVHMHWLSHRSTLYLIKCALQSALNILNLN